MLKDINSLYAEDLPQKTIMPHHDDFVNVAGLIYYYKGKTVFTVLHWEAGKNNYCILKH